MQPHLSFVEYFAIIISVLGLALAQDIDIIPEKPTFPDVFQVELEGIFQEEMAEVDGSIYYDRPNNRVVLSYTYQNDTTTSIYNFNDSQLIYISGVECSVSEISEESGSFFQYKVDKVTKKKTLASPEEIFFFTKSEYLMPQPASRYPSYVYKANLDIAQYELTNCTIIHIFSKQEEQRPNCDGHLCKPTLVTLSVTCPSPTQEDPDVSHVYNFFRFKSAIKDVSVFQPPVGVHCDVVGHKPFPEFPLYFSFSYELIEEQKGSDIAAGVYTVYKKVWYDTKLKIIRMDEFDEDGLLLTSRIFDFYGHIAYTIVASLPVCEPGDLEDDVPLDEMTRLPKVLIAMKPEDKKKAVYIGQRSVHGLDYHVWTQSLTDDETEAKNVYEYYFTNNIQMGATSKNSYLQFSHADIYTYEKNDSTGVFELKLQTYLAVSNFRSKPKEWEAFDVSSCFKKEEKKGFSLKVEGPPIIKDSLMFEEVLEKLYMKLIIVTNTSLIRISQLEGRFTGIYVTEFTGWILKKIEIKGREGTNNEPDMEETYTLIEKAAAEGKLTIKIKKEGKDQVYKITSVSVKSNAAGTCISGGTMAIVSVILLFMGISFGFVGYYVFLKKKKPLSIDKVQLHTMH